tara:strand:- start:1417 stop:2085 length:669 start_codon:yes stop_codon:yes gene_type:complete
MKGLKNIHKGKDIWLLLAGSSMDHINQSFFEGKITIGQNHMFKLFPCNYIVMKDCLEKPRFPRSIEELNKLGIPLIYSKHYKGHATSEENIVQHDNAHCFSHNPRKEGVWLKDEIPNLQEDDIIVSRSTVTTLMHIAAYMGAKNIILCGHDCGKLDNNLYTKGYIEKDWILAKWSGIDSFIGKLEDESKLVRDYLQKRYGVNIHSINPFLNLGLEGHKFDAC